MKKVIVTNIKDARERIAQAFRDDPGFREGYVANVACLLLDNVPGFKRNTKRLFQLRNALASKIIDLIFES